MLDKPILGAALFGDLDQYDIVHPAILAEGTILARGAGRLILDGDASDVILKIDHEYFSLRELFGIGPGIDSTPRAPPPPAAAGDETAVLRSQLCGGVSIVPVVTCPLRRNFGTDSCNEADTVCYCGGGYDYLTRTIRLRHLVCRETVPCEDVFIGQNIAAYCCAPGTDAESFHCKTAFQEFTAAQNPNYYWVDRYAECDAYVEGTLCLNVDRNQYLDTYVLDGVSVGLLDQPEELVRVRRQLNLHTWGITRDYVFDNGEAHQTSFNGHRFMVYLARRIYFFLVARETSESQKLDESHTLVMWWF